jgi:hypothetical protein
MTIAVPCGFKPGKMDQFCNYYGMKDIEKGQIFQSAEIPDRIIEYNSTPGKSILSL